MKMTIEKHIENLKKLKSFHNGSYGASVNAGINALEHEQALREAFNIALLYGKEKGMESIDKALYQIGMDGIKEQEIKALEQESYKVSEYDKDHIWYKGWQYISLRRFLEVKKALEQEPCEDEYIKVPKKALKYRTAGMVAYNAEWLKNHFDIERAVICGAQQPCEDAIRRSEAIKAIDEREDVNGKVDAESVRTDIALMPPVTPQPKTGHWIDVNKGKWNTIPAYKCSACGVNADLRDWSGKSPFCPWCGAKMVETQESEG